MRRVHSSNFTPASGGDKHVLATSTGRRFQGANGGLSVWIVADTARRLGRKKAADNLSLPPSLVAAALDYAADFADEISEDATLGNRTLKECGLKEANQ